MSSDIISEISGIDSKLRRSAAVAAFEIQNTGSELYNIIFDTGLRSKSFLAARCTEACARAASKDPGLAKARAKQTITAVLNNPEPDVRYYLAVIMINIEVPVKQAKKCALMIHKWMKEENGRGAKAAFLEAIAYLSVIDGSIGPLANDILNEALNSPVPSYAARARQVITRMKKKNSI